MPRLPLPWRRNLAKAQQQFPAQTPPAIEQAMSEQGMDSSVQLGPGRPMNPAWGYSTRPRAMDYPAGVNIATGSNRQAWGRTSYDTLRAIIGAYDVARDCINHKIDELRSMEPLFIAVDGFSGDTDAAIAAARAALEFPDRELPFDAWLSKWLESVLKFDAGHLYRRRNYAGDVIGLESVDGTTIAPLLDGNGRRPRPPAPAWQQVIRGLRTQDLTADDLIPTIFRPQENSPFGLAPIESVLLPVNTDLRLQWHFLQMFTEGSVPAGFMEVPPDTSSPDQVDEWQQYWDAFMIGDQAKLRQIIAVPSGSKLTETRPRTFDTNFAKFLMLRTCAAFGVVPQDLGLIDDVNRANGETQTDMQFRVNTLPWVLFVQRTLTRYLRKDLGLPVQVKLDTGRDVVDRVAEAQAWKIGTEGGAVSADEWRQEVYGLPIDNERPVPRGFMNPRTGFVPLRSVFDIAGRVDPETGAPVDDQPLDTTPFDGAGGVLADKSPGGSQFKRAPVNPDEPEFPHLEHEVPGSDVLGTTPATKPLITDPQQGQQVQAAQASADPVQVAENKAAKDDQPAQVGKSAAAADELAAFRRFVARQAKAGRWRRDFEFTATDPRTAHGLNQQARSRVRKAAGQVVAAGLAVVAADTGRVLMLQRALDPTDPAGGTWEFPGGHLEDGEMAPEAAEREWQEETGVALPEGHYGDLWTSPDGVYQGQVYVVPSEADVPIFDRAEGMNPDDPDGDAVEALAWWEPAQLAGNPAVRPELAADLDTVLPLIGQALAPAGDSCPCGLPVVFDEDNGWQHVDGSVSHDGDFYGQSVSELMAGKAPAAVAKSWRDGAEKTPAHHVDLKLVDFWAPRITAALGSLLTADDIRGAIAAAKATLPTDETGNVAKAADPLRDAIAQQVSAHLADHADPAALEQTVRQVIADGYLAGGMAARRQLGPNSVTLDGDTGQAIADLDWESWQPGDVDAAIRTADGGLASLLDQAGIGINGITGTALDGLGNQIADGLLDGLPVDDVAASLSDWSSGFNAERIAHTEIARAQDAATQAIYVANGVELFDVVLSDDACPECEDVAENGPYQAGDSQIPVHPLCRCASSPHNG